MARVFFVRDMPGAANDLWVTDGTAGGTHRVGTGLTNARQLAQVDGALFVATEGSTPQLWAVDPTTEQTTFLANTILNPFGIGTGLNKDNPAALNGELFFVNSDQTNGLELWHSDGTPEGTGLLKDLRPGFFPSSPTELTTIGDAIYFRASGGQGSELWRSDGSAAGTVQVKDIRPGGAADGSTPLTFTDVNGRAFFQADDGVHGWELWVSDGTEAGTTMVKDIWPGSDSGLIIQTFAVLDNVLIFGARDATHGSALWRSDGTENGTVMIAEINPGSANAIFSSQFITFGDAVYFAADDGVHGTELWRTDGTESGTFMVADLNASGSGWPVDFTVVGDALFFAADDGVHGKELWRFDGTGVSLVADLNPGSGSTQIYSATVADDVLFFTAWPVGEPWEVSLWRSDGTANGTIRLADRVDFNVDIVATNDGISPPDPTDVSFTTGDDDVDLPVEGGAFDMLGGNDTARYAAGTTGGVTLDGNTGIDTFSFQLFGSAVWVDLQYVGTTNEAWTRDTTHVNSGTWREIANLSNVENLIGTVHSDKLWGNGSDNVFSYTGGLDTFDGRAGSDTADFSLFGSAVWVDLQYTGTPNEAWTRDTTHLNGGTWREIADLSNVENIVGGSGSDSISGDGGNNRLTGGANSDTLFGRGGTDTAVFSGALLDYRITHFTNGEVLVTDLRAGQNDGVDTLNGIEMLSFSNGDFVLGTFTETHDITFLPTAGGTFNGLGGDDIARYANGTTGGVVFNGGAGTDTFSFQSFGSAVWVDLQYIGTVNEAWTRDTTHVDSGTWREIADLSGVENLIGTDHSDRMGGNANDNMFFYRGLVGSSGVDAYDGRGGTDTADFLQFGAAVWVDLEFTNTANEAWTRDNAGLTSGTWRPIADLTNIENLTGTVHADQLFGNANANRLEGGAGNDELTGRGGNDIFVFFLGQDTITDFTGAGAAVGDQIQLSLGSAFDTFAEVQAVASVSAGNTVLNFGGGNTLTLTGVTAALHQNDFLFV